MEKMLSWVKAVLAVTPETWRRWARDLPAELLSSSPAPGQWSTLECLEHLIDVERLYQFRLGCLLKGQDFPAFDPDRQGKAADRPATELAEEFAERRTGTLKALAPIGVGDFARTARHQELGPVTLGQLLHAWAGHDLNHTVQAERAMMQPFIRGCGAWHKYFSDHQAK
jgi:hypothetical protein